VPLLAGLPKSAHRLPPPHLSPLLFRCLWSLFPRRAAQVTSAEAFPVALQLNASDSTGLDLLLVSRPCAGCVRVVLRWGAAPKDLDLHVTNVTAPPGDPESWSLLAATEHSYYNQTGENWGGVTLDADSQEGFGPETVTWTANSASGVYYVAVVVFETNETFTAASAGDTSVAVYGGEGLLGLFAPTGSAIEGLRLWTVIKVTKTSEGGYVLAAWNSSGGASDTNGEGTGSGASNATNGSGGNGTAGGGEADGGSTSSGVSNATNGSGGNGTDGGGEADGGSTSSGESNATNGSGGGGTDGGGEADGGSTSSGVSNATNGSGGGGTDGGGEADGGSTSSGASNATNGSGGDYTDGGGGAGGAGDGGGGARDGGGGNSSNLKISLHLRSSQVGSRVMARCLDA
jgi:hypothetical protein